MGLVDGMAWEKEYGTDHVPTKVTIHTNRTTILLSLDPKDLAFWLKKSDKKYAKKLFKALKKELK